MAPPELTHKLGRTALVITEYDDIVKVFAHKDLARGVTSRSLPYVLNGVLDTLFSVKDAFFFGQMENNVPEHAARHAWTTATLNGPEHTSERLLASAKQVADLSRAGDHDGATRATMQYFLRHFLPDFVVTQADLEDVRFVLSMVLPGVRWISPIHNYWLANAKERISTRVGGIECYHHICVSSTVYSSVLQRALSPKGLEHIRSAGATGGFSVLGLFNKAVPTEVFRTVTAETDLDGLSPSRLPVGALVFWNLSNATAHEHRFLTCCAQTIVLAFVEAVLRAYDPTLPIVSAASNGKLITYNSHS